MQSCKSARQPLLVLKRHLTKWKSYRTDVEILTPKLYERFILVLQLFWIDWNGIILLLVLSEQLLWTVVDMFGKEIFCLICICNFLQLFILNFATFLALKSNKKCSTLRNGLMLCVLTPTVSFKEFYEKATVPYPAIHAVNSFLRPFDFFIATFRVSNCNKNTLVIRINNCWQNKGNSFFTSLIV